MSVNNSGNLLLSLTLPTAPPSARGFLVGQHGTWIVFGYAIAGWVGVGTYYSTNLSFQWRFPIALACIPPLCLLGCGPWIPESPRWCTSDLVYFLLTWDADNV